MKELITTPTNRKPMALTGTSAEVAALDNLLTLVNSIPVENPPGTRPAITSGYNPGHEGAPANGDVNIFDAPASTPAENEVLTNPTSRPTPNPASAPPGPAQPLSVPGLSGRKIFFTGRMFAGKDYLANAAHRQVFGLADPLYGLANHFFNAGVSAANKDQPGIREFLQKVGQWGRGTVSGQYPLTTERAVFVTMIRSLATARVLGGDFVAWNSFGENEDIWLDSCVNRAQGVANAAVANVRFENEFKRFKAEQFQHWHVMCSGPTWTTRLAARGLQPGSPQVSDLSEQFAVGLDNQVTKKVSQQRLGPKLHVVWSDPGVPSPSARFYTVAEFLQEVNS